MTHDNGDMRVIGAGFEREEQAHAAERDLRALLDVEGMDIVTHPVAGDPEFVNGSHFVLAGRIRAARLPAVRDVFERHGGSVLTEVPEAWTTPWPHT